MEWNQFVYASLAALVGGVFLLFSDSKKRTETGEWGSALQWGYLLLMIGVFGFLSAGLSWSFTAVLLLFVLFTGVVWIWSKISRKGTTDALDSNHFRDYMAGFFPIIGIVFILRTFIAEPFQIPSSSMRPGLVKGDFILVNKFAYGIRIPVLNNVLINIGTVQRGDVAVFNFPVNPQVNYIKRIIGIPGDVIEYKDKILRVNGVVEHDTLIGNYHYADDNMPNITNYAERFHADLDKVVFDILKKNNGTSVDPATFNHYQEEMGQKGFESGLLENCQYAADGSAFRCTVPDGKYFAMGDNRDSSADSRYWGFIDDKLIVGKAFFIWMNFGDMARVGTTIR